jgi:type II secretory pathway component PulJ
MPRSPTRGFTLLPTLAAILLLAGLTLLLQSRSQANLALLSRLTADLQAQPARDALYDRLRPLVAEAMAADLLPGFSSVRSLF